MKTRVLTAALVGGAILSLGSLQAFQNPTGALLPNVDKRTPASGPGLMLTTTPRGTGFTAAQLQAAANLRNRLPNLVVSAHNLTRSPRLVASEDGFLTGRGGVGGGVSAPTLAAIPASDPHRVVKAFLNENRALFGYGADSLDIAVVARDYVTKHNGLHTTVWQQRVGGVPVFEAVLQSHVTAKGELVNVASQFVGNPVAAANQGTPAWTTLLQNPPISMAQALAQAAADVGDAVSENAVRRVSEPVGADLDTKLRAPLLSGDCYAKLVWLPMNASSLRLAWQVVFVSKARQEMYLSVVDAQTGGVVVRHNLTCYAAPAAPVAATYNVYLQESPSPFNPGWQSPSDVQPPLQPRTLVTNLTALDLTASPAGWLDAADQFTGAYTTTGNNVDAHTDMDDDNNPDLPRPSSTEDPPVFDFPLDLSLQPTTHTNATVVNLFYLNNFMHDKLYELGFTEAAGNFQNNNFGRGGLGDDAVEADALDGALLSDYAHRNNANFYPPPDGYPGRMQMYIFDGPVPNRDGSLDAGVVCHEYTHGLSGRLVGGGVGITALQTAGMGEGWSDFYSLALLTKATDDPHACYQEGAYASYLISDLTENYYFGIRRYPYSTDMQKNPLTYKDIDPSQADEHFGIPRAPWIPNYPDEVHNQGEVWCMMLWEVWANLIDTYGWATGNQLAMQLVTDGMKLGPANPTYVEARDAIVEADRVLTGGANLAEIWTGFAKRGLGDGATAPASDTTIGVVESYDLPPGIGIQPPTGVLSLTVTPPDRATVLSGTNVSVFIRVRDGVGVTNATVTAKVNGSIDLPVGNTGTAPDARPADSIYTGLLNVPANATNVTLYIAANAPDKTNATLSVTYFVAQQPVNDLFKNRSKVNAPGGYFYTNNKFATTEPGEPAPAASSNFVASLWWTWTPTNDAPVLVDSAGSAFQSVIGVYTGSNLTNLTEVKAVGTVPERKQSYLYFNAKKGQTYQISVAGASPANAGVLQLRITPNGSPDITPPVITVARPASGYIWTNNVVEVVANAVDPEPLATGVDQITFQVGPSSFGPAQPTSATADESVTNRIALSEGRNTITVTATDLAGNASMTNIMVTYRRPEPPNDHFVNATLLQGDAGTNSVANALATRENGEPRHAGNDGGKSVWWKWQAPNDGVLLLSTEGSDFDTLLGLYTGEYVNALITVASNDDAYDGVKFSKLAAAVRSNTVYAVAVDGFNAATGMVQLAYTFTPAKLFQLTLTKTAGGLTDPATGVIDVQANASVQLTADPDPGYEFAGWQGDINTSENPVPVPVTKNLAVQAVFRAQAIADDFESGGLTRQPWVTGGDVPWYVTDESAALGKYSVRSGQIGNNQTSSLKLTQTLRAGTASFDLRVSSEPNYDFLQFYVDGTLVEQWSGEIGWLKFEFSVTAGPHTLEWRYVKDPARSLGSDVAFIDNVALPLVVPSDGTQPVLSIGRAFTGGVEVRLQGQTNQIYVIQAATNFPARWQGIYTNQAAYGELRFVDPDSVTIPNRVYRGVAP